MKITFNFFLNFVKELKAKELRSNPEEIGIQIWFTTSTAPLAAAKRANKRGTALDFSE
jgi:hypothetical protein